MVKIVQGVCFGKIMLQIFFSEAGVLVLYGGERNEFCAAIWLKLRFLC